MKPTMLYRCSDSLRLLLAFLCVLCTLCWRSEARPALSLSATRVYGPGIHPKRSSLPINYFYVQAVDTDGNK